MKNLKKALPAVSALAMMTTTLIPANSSVVYANETKVKENVETVLKTNSERGWSEKDRLYQILEEAQLQETQRKEAFDKAQKEKQELEAKLQAQKEVYAQNVAAAQSAQTAANDELIRQLEENLKSIESLQKDIEEAKAKKDSSQKTLDAKKEEATKAQETLNQAKQELEMAQKEAEENGLTPEILSQMQAEFEQAQTALKEAELSYNQAKEEHATIEQTIQTLQEELVRLEGVYSQAQADSKQALIEVQNAQSILEEKKAAYESTLDPVLKEQALAEVEKAKESLAIVVAQKDVVDASIAQMEQEIAKIEANLSEMERPLTEMDEKVKLAETAKLDAERVVTETQDSLQKEQAKHKDLLAQKEAAQKNIAEKQKAFDAANQDHWDKLQAQIKAEDDFRDAQAKVDTLTSQMGQQSTEFAKGSLGFFESIGAKKAVEFLNHPKKGFGQYTNIGATGDATSLLMMRESISYIRQCNELRKKHGLSELKISSEMMAIAQLQTNASVHTLGHTHQYNVGENLAWGHSNPFNGWYDSEKRVYDYVTQVLGLSGKHNDVVNLDSATKDKIVEACNLSGHGYVQTGHYLNIINPEYTMTGFAMNTVPNQEYGVTHGQAFMYTINNGMIYPGDTAHYDDGGVYTVSQYEKMFESYFNKVSQGAQQNEALAAQLKEAVQWRDKCKEESARRRALAEEAKIKSKQLQKEWDEAKKIPAEIESQIKKSQAIITEKESLLSNAQNSLKEKTNVYTQLVSERDALKTQIDAQTQDIRSELQTAKKEYQAKLEEQKGLAARVEEAKTNLKNKEDYLQEVAGGDPTAKAEYDKATEVYNSAVANQKVMDAKTLQAKGNVDAQKEEIQKTEDQLAKTEARLTESKGLFDEATQTMAKTEEKWATEKACYEKLTNAQETVQKEEKRNEELQKTIKELSSSIQQLDATVQNKEELLTEANAIRVEVLKAQSAWEAALKGENVSYKADVQVLKQFEKAMEQYLSAKEMEMQCKEELDALNSKVEQSQKTYSETKQAYNDAKANTQKAMDALNVYLESQKPNKNEEPQKQNGTNTGVSTGVGVSMLGMLTGLVGVVVCRNRKKD